VPDRASQQRNESLTISSNFYVDAAGRVFYFFQRDNRARPEGMTARIGGGPETGTTPWEFTSVIQGQNVAREQAVPFEMSATLQGNVLSLEASITHSGRWPDGQALSLFRASLERIELAADGTCRLLSSNFAFRVSSGNTVLRAETCRAAPTQSRCSSTVGPPSWLRR
jgi:hypothetical protein